MALENELLELEERFWKEGPDFYRGNLTDESLMVFSDPVGLLTKDRIVEIIASAPRWAKVGFDEVHLVRVSEDVVILTYKASANREGGHSEYSARASSVYVHIACTWKLAFHQQTPSA